MRIRNFILKPWLDHTNECYVRAGEEYFIVEEVDSEVKELFVRLIGEHKDPIKISLPLENPLTIDFESDCSAIQFLYKCGKECKVKIIINWHNFAPKQ